MSNSLIICLVMVVTLIAIYFIFSKDNTTIDSQKTIKHEIPPTILKKAVFTEVVIKAETKDIRQKEFNKSYITFKKNNKDKIKQQNVVYERSIVKREEEKAKVIDAMYMVETMENNAKNKLKKLAGAFAKIGNEFNEE